MHVIFRESHGLEETETPVDLGQAAAELVVLSFSDSDLGAFAAGWHRGGGAEGRMPSLRLANLAALKHPLSVDTYVERTLDGARGILIRLIGGVPYWSYGLQQVEALARAKGIALAVLPADGRPDPRLDAVSTVPPRRSGGWLSIATRAARWRRRRRWRSSRWRRGSTPGRSRGRRGCRRWAHGRPRTAWPARSRCRWGTRLSSCRLLPLLARRRRPRAGRGADRRPSRPRLPRPRPLRPLAQGARRARLARAAGRAPRPRRHRQRHVLLGARRRRRLAARYRRGPVFQVALATSSRAAWAEAERGLSPADLAMHVVLPEVDGRLFAGVASFKEPEARDEALQFSRYAHRPEPARIAAIADRVAGWHRLATTPAAERRLALVLSTYPGRDVEPRPCRRPRRAGLGRSDPRRPRRRRARHRSRPGA
jgi:cobaltochelatase CobN